MNKHQGMYSTIDGELRTLEVQAEKLLSQLSVDITQVTANSSVPQELAANLDTRAEKIDELFRVAHEPGAPATAVAQAQRHREKLDEHRVSGQRQGEELRSACDRHNLLSMVRADIELHRQQEAQTEDQYYYGEGGRIEQSHSLADRLLEQAQETRADMMNQAQVLKNIQKRVWNTASSVPGINTLISKVNSRQKRNSLVLAAVVTLCVLFLVFM